MSKSPWHQSNAGMFADNKKYFNEKYGGQTEQDKLKRINRVSSDKYAMNVMSYVKFAESSYSLDI